MARKARENSISGIYHVMLRGVNRQDIFECEKDYLKFLDLLRRAAFPRDDHARGTRYRNMIFRPQGDNLRLGCAVATV